MHPAYEKANHLSDEVIGAAIEIHPHKGPGLIESIYERCLLRELELRSISAVTRKIVRVEYKGLVFHEPFRFDLHRRMQRQRRDFVVTSPPQTLCFLCSLAKAFGVAFCKKL